MDEDPENLNLSCMVLLQYARAKGAFDDAKGDPEKLKAYEGDPLMKKVERLTFDKHKARLDHRRKHVDFGVTDLDCRYCRKEAQP